MRQKCVGIRKGEAMRKNTGAVAVPKTTAALKKHQKKEIESGPRLSKEEARIIELKS